MADITMKNEQIEIGINYHGAELRSIRKLATDTEYLWCADPAFWNRSSPVLFPFVGMVKDGIYRHEGKEYKMGQHGFARDKDFKLVSQTADEIWFELDDDEDSIARFPLHFHLEIGYKLLENGVVVMWKVKNPAEEVLHFSIGAHPAFNCPVREGEKQTDCAFLLKDFEGNPIQEFNNTIFGTGGTVTPNHEMVRLENGLMPITEHLFDNDAKVIENSQVGSVAILDKAGEAYLTVEFTSPLVGIWSPPKKQAPFVCIEPWYGRCDQEDFTGDLKDREWGNQLAEGEEFSAEYRILV